MSGETLSADEVRTAMTHLSPEEQARLRRAFREILAAVRPFWDSRSDERGEVEVGIERARQQRAVQAAYREAVSLIATVATRAQGSGRFVEYVTQPPSDLVLQPAGAVSFGPGVCSAESGGNHCHEPVSHRGWHRDHVTHQAWPWTSQEFLGEQPRTHRFYVCPLCEARAAENGGQGGWQLEQVVTETEFWRNQIRVWELLDEHRVACGLRIPWHIVEVTL